MPRKQRRRPKRKNFSEGSSLAPDIITAFGGWKILLVIPLAILLFGGGTIILVKIINILKTPLVSGQVPVWSVVVVVILYFMWKRRQGGF